MALETLASKILSVASLPALIQEPENNHIGFAFAMSYDEVRLVTNDAWRERVGGVSENSLLLAASFNPGNYQDSDESQRNVLLLRVLKPISLPSEADSIKAIVEHHQGQTTVLPIDKRDGIEPITHAQLQFGGLLCRVLGTFYEEENGSLRLGADVEDFLSATNLRAYKPTPDVLQQIVNYVDPARLAKSTRDAAQLGFDKLPRAFEIGTLRYTSTNRLQKNSGTAAVPVEIQPLDFIGRRTAVLGMTRTGKSNTVKTMVSAVALSATAARVNIGQLIFDMNGEYANANGQDDGSSIAEVFADITTRYRGFPTAGFEDLRNNFYVSLGAGLATLQSVIASDPTTKGQDMQILLQMSLDEPSEEDMSEYQRWRLRVAMYKALLYKNNFPAARADDVAVFSMNKRVAAAVYRMTSYFDSRTPPPDEEQAKAALVRAFGDPEKGIPLSKAVELFEAIRVADRRAKAEQKQASRPEIGLESTTRGKSWLDLEHRALLNLIAQKSENDGFIRVSSYLRLGLPYHSVRGTDNVARDIYELLASGRIIILDLSVGAPDVRERLSKQIAQFILEESMRTFNSAAAVPPRIVLYMEEVHNLIGKEAKLTEVWPRIAKEGAKFGLALVYSTQEPSSIHPNIMANTENFFVTHLNNENELRALSDDYDFADFKDSLKRAQDIGFARVKTLSSPFVIPTQIREFKPELIKPIYSAAKVKG